MIITRTPYRVSFFGGGTDYPSWYRKKGGLVIGTTIANYCYVSCRRLPPFFDYRTRLVYSQMESVESHDQIKHPAIRGCLECLDISEGLEIHHDGDLPARSGLGSSSSFTVGLLLALRGLRHEMPTKAQLATQAIFVEQEVLKENVGIQDQILTAHGGLQVLEIKASGEYHVHPLILPREYRRELESQILLGFTGLTRIASDIAASQVKKMEQGTSRTAETLDIAREAMELFSRNDDLQMIGRLLHKSWQLKRTMASGITNALIDEIYETAVKAGAYGGKILGAGGGGFMMFLAPKSRHQKIKESLQHVKVWVPFKFETEGARVVFHNDNY